MSYGNGDGCEIVRLFGVLSSRYLLQNNSDYLQCDKWLKATKRTIPVSNKYPKHYYNKIS